MPAIKMIVIGASKGGLSALRTLLAALPEHFPLPVAIVQHRAAETDSGLRAALQKQILLPVVEVEDKELILGGRIYLAPADYHLLVDSGCFALSTEGPVCYARPSVDVLFESAADAGGAGVLAVVLTGANHDGAAGAAAVKRRGGRVVVQDPARAEHPAMPRAAIAALHRKETSDCEPDGNEEGGSVLAGGGKEDQSAIPNPQSAMVHILPLEEIGPFIVGEAAGR